jgi:NADH-quinone oxidoreductase subunit M
VVAATGVILAAVYLLWAYQRVFHGQPKGDNERVVDLKWRELAVMAPLMALMLFFGLYPKPLLSRVQPSVNHLIVHVERHTNYRQPAVATHQAHSTRSHNPHGQAAATHKGVGK